jgi:hypothetical protein
VKDGKIVVSASEKEVKSKVGRVVSKARTKPASAISDETVVIVGGGSGAIHTIESLRMVSGPRGYGGNAGLMLKLRLQNDYQGKIVVISEEPYAPIDR